MKVKINDSTIEFIDGLASVSQRYDTFILDIWGVLHDGTRLYPGVQLCLKKLKQNQKRILLLSNSARLPFEIEKQIAALGISAELYDYIYSSGELTREILAAGTDQRLVNLGKKYFLFGSKRYKLAEGLDLRATEDLAEADFVLAIGIEGNPRTTAEAEPLLQEAVSRNLTMVCANPDMQVVRDTIMGIGSGALAVRYEELNGRVIYFGKPHKEIYDRCLELLGQDTGRVVAIGDSLHTDIAGANGSGLDSILIGGGIHAEQFATAAADISGLSALIDNRQFIPTMIAKGFFW